MAGRNRLRLMHAAPRLLTSLASLTQQADEDCPNEYRSHHFVDALEDARDAIASATPTASLQAVLEPSMSSEVPPGHEAKAYTESYTLLYVDGNERRFYDHTDGWVYYLDSDGKLMATTIDHSEHHAANSWDKHPLTQEERQMIMEGLTQSAVELPVPSPEVTVAGKGMHAPKLTDGPPPHPWPAEIAEANRQKQAVKDNGQAKDHGKNNGHDGGHSM